MILPIYLYGQPVLRKPTEEIEPGEIDVKQLVADMQETLTAAEGCGLAAPQVGKSIRLFIVDGTELGEDYPECVDFKQVFINPEIIATSDETATYSEGCLSLPGKWGTTRRPKHVTVRAQGLDGNEVEYSGSDLLARAFCHELDHLDGKLFTDALIGELEG